MLTYIPTDKQKPTEETSLYSKKVKNIEKKYSLTLSKTTF